MQTTWNFAPGAFGTGYKIAETINRAAEKYNLSMRRILRLGPRFFIASCTKEKEDALLKVCLEPYAPAPGLKTAPKSMLQEAKILSFLERRQSRFADSLPHVYGFSRPSGYAWMVRRYEHGKTFQRGKSNFLFSRSFFTRKRGEEILSFLASLHTQTNTLPHTLRKQLRIHTLSDYEQCIPWKQALSQTKERTLARRVSRALKKFQNTFNNAPRVLTHHELYPAHIQKKKNGTLSFIDWENIGLNNPLHDALLVWIRSFEYPRWQKWFLRRTRELLLPNNTFHDIFYAEVIMQSLGNLNFFLGNSLTKEEKTVKKQAVSFFVKLLKNITKKL